jgi:hypothetical protein
MVIDGDLDITNPGRPSKKPRTDPAIISAIHYPVSNPLHIENSSMVNNELTLSLSFSGFYRLSLDANPSKMLLRLMKNWNPSRNHWIIHSLLYW